jgi:hypothetical protein
MAIVTKRDSKGKLIISTKHLPKKKPNSPQKDGAKSNQCQQAQPSSSHYDYLEKGCLSLSYLGSPNSSRSTSNPA